MSYNLKNRSFLKLLDFSKFEDTWKELEDQLKVIREENAFLKSTGSSSERSGLSAGGRDLELELGQAIAMNKKIQAERENLLFVFREIVKAAKKKKHSFHQAIKTLNNEEDRELILNLVKEQSIKIK